MANLTVLSPSEFEFYTKIQEKGGKAITPFAKGSQKVTIQCSYGHQWQVTTYNIREGKWCPKCAGNDTTQSIQKLLPTKMVKFWGITSIIIQKFYFNVNSIINGTPHLLI